MNNNNSNRGSKDLLVKVESKMSDTEKTKKTITNNKINNSRNHHKLIIINNHYNQYNRMSKDLLVNNKFKNII